jgi:hypothetical protein
VKVANSEAIVVCVFIICFFSMIALVFVIDNKIDAAYQRGLEECKSGLLTDSAYVAGFWSGMNVAHHGQDIKVAAKNETIAWLRTDQHSSTIYWNGYHDGQQVSQDDCEVMMSAKNDTIAMLKYATWLSVSSRQSTALRDTICQLRAAKTRVDTVYVGYSPPVRPYIGIHFRMKD